MVGQGPEVPALASLRALPGVTVENRWVPESEVGALLAWADALVLSHTEASQSGAAAAAVAARRWVVATRVGGIAEQLAREPLARLCDPTPESLADAISSTEIGRRGKCRGAERCGGILARHGLALDRRAPSPRSGRRLTRDRASWAGRPSKPHALPPGRWHGRLSRQKGAQDFGRAHQGQRIMPLALEQANGPARQSTPDLCARDGDHRVFRPVPHLTRAETSETLKPQWLA